MDNYFLIHGYDTLKTVGLGAMIDSVEKLEAILKENGNTMPVRDVYRSMGITRDKLEKILDAAIELRETIKPVKVDGIKKLIYIPNISSSSSICQ